MMKRYKYLVGLIALMLFVSSGVSLRAQYKITRDTTFIFSCRKDVPIDLNQAMGVQISHTHGYWGDSKGLPFTNDDVWPFAKNNLFNARKADTGSYTFYFYFTSSTEYCGMSAGDSLKLTIHVRKMTCYDPRSSAPLGEEFFFCYGTNLVHHAAFSAYDSGEKLLDPKNMEQMMFSTVAEVNQHRWKKDTVDHHNSDWLDFLIFTDSLGTQPAIGNNKTTVDELFEHFNKTDPALDNDITVYIAVTMHDGTIYRSHGIKIVVYHQAVLEIIYTPDIRTAVNRYRDYDIDQNIEIFVRDENADTASYIYKYYLNDKYLNDQFMGGVTDQDLLNLNALAFTGLEDVIRIEAEVKHGNRSCFVQASDDVIVNVPFPNAFTPDGDGINDVFLGGVKYRNREFHLEIFNRWGNRLYFGEDGWDGTYQGADVAPGEYGYVVKFKAPDGTTRTLKGFVTLLRKRM